GVAGMTVALEIARQGFNVDLVEREKELGGSLVNMNSVFLNATDPKKIITPLKEAVEKDKRITVHTNSNAKELAGYTGNFELDVEENTKTQTISTGAIVVATGSREKKPEGMYLYGKNPNVITQMELEDRFKKGDFTSENVVMIQCVGARDENLPGCSRTCCVDAVKNAKLLKEKNPNSRVFILYRDMMMFGIFEDGYRNSQSKLGVEFLRYSPEKPPTVEEKEGKLVVTVYDSLFGREIEIGADKIILSTPQVPSEGTEELQKILRVPLSPQGFFLEGHVKLRPLEFISDGLYLCGSCQSPKELSLAIAQAAGAASKVCSLLSHDIMETEATTSVVNEELCIACGRCIEICPFSAISFKENENGEQKSWINSAMCKSCGLCASVCPNGAITPRHFSTPQIIAMIDALLEA
ncbi:MAG: CoB--CoM heterodisulfide reductase iron-sulfur subunit A family protein, partial [Candidatus Hydrothermarchaeales archaeon]